VAAADLVHRYRARRSHPKGPARRLRRFLFRIVSGWDNREPDFEKIDANVVRLAPPQPDAFGFAPYGDTLVVKESAATI